MSKHHSKAPRRISRGPRKRLREDLLPEEKPRADTRRFPLPAPDWSVDSTESPWTPRIVHSCDYMRRDNGAPEFHYNYLDYFWRVDGKEIRARHYLRRSGMRAVAVMLPLTEFDQPKYTGILQYLQRRFAIIETFEPEGYVMRWMVE